MSNRVETVVRWGERGGQERGRVYRESREREGGRKGGREPVREGGREREGHEGGRREGGRH